MDATITNATEADRYGIALCVAQGFEKEFSTLCKNTKKVALAIAGGLYIEKFYVAKKDGEIAGVLAISDCNGRATKVDKASLKKQFGLIKGLLANFVLKHEFEKQLDYPNSTGYIEFVAVQKSCRQKGIATFMLKESIKLSGYQHFVLDVTDINLNAIGCYTNLGFKEFKRVPEKFAKQKGFNATIYMRYSNKTKHAIKNDSNSQQENHTVSAID